MSVFGVILVRSFPTFSRIRTEYREVLRIYQYSVWMRENAGKMRTRITPNRDDFYAVSVDWLFHFFIICFMPKKTFYLVWWGGSLLLRLYGNRPVRDDESRLAQLPGWLGSELSKIFLWMRFLIFPGFPAKKVVPLTRRSAKVCLVQKC